MPAVFGSYSYYVTSPVIKMQSSDRSGSNVESEESYRYYNGEAGGELHEFYKERQHPSFFFYIFIFGIHMR
jgi:hypothetical protein